MGSWEGLSSPSHIVANGAPGRVSTKAVPSPKDEISWQGIAGQPSRL